MLAWGWARVRLCVPSHGKGYCVRRRALIQSLYLRGCINWLQMAHMVLIKDYLAAAGSVRVCSCVCVCLRLCVRACTLESILSKPEQQKCTCLCTEEYECLYAGIKLHKMCVCLINVSAHSSIYIYSCVCRLAVCSDKIHQQINEWK